MHRTRTLAWLLLLTLALPGWRTESARVWERFEAILPLPVGPENPFDPDAVAVEAEFRAPGGGQVRVPAFVYRGYAQERLPDGRERLDPAGELEWRVRFTPNRPGLWRWRWMRTAAGNTEIGPWQELRVQPSRDPDRHGFLRRSPADPRYLRFDDGAPFFAVGENLGWYDGRGTFAYEEWLAELAAQGANYVRLWMPSWAMGLVYAPAELDDWTARLDRAWQLDRVLELAERHGIYVMLSVQNHGPFDLGGFFGTEWGTNLYSAANGGPLAHPSRMFSDSRAREVFRNYLRYVVARWSHSPHVLCFELWNEADLVEAPLDMEAVTDWHREMARHVRALDPNDHLVSTSTTDEMMVFAWWFGASIAEFPLDFDPVWALPEIDFVQLHAYQIASWGVRTPVHEAFPDLVGRMRSFGKPVLVAEAGVDFHGPNETLAEDPLGEGFHDILWAGLFAESFGTGMSWWWDNVVDPEDWYFHLGHVARFLEGVVFDREGFEASVEPVAAGPRHVAARVLRGRGTLLAWVKNADHEYWHPDRSPVEGARLELPSLRPGSWRGHWIDTWSGATLDVVELIARGEGERPELAVPPFARDVALRLERVQGGSSRPVAPSAGARAFPPR